MENAHNIFVKLQIGKDHQSGNLVLSINFDKNAPNFSIDKSAVIWIPTGEEIEFILETYETISQNKRSSERHFDEKEMTFSPPEKIQKKDKQQSSESRIAMFEPVQEDRENNTVSSGDDEEKKETDKKIFIQADEETIDEVLRRKNIDIDKECVALAEDKQAIDRMVKKREKKKSDNEY
jgi:hypothetical protein